LLDSYELAAGSIGTKVSCLLQEIKDMIHKDSTNKAVVFSQIVGTLDCAAQEMAARGMRFVRIDDDMKQYERADALSSFRPTQT
jgi:superfamily II DNA/RNA helicase